MRRDTLTIYGDMLESAVLFHLDANSNAQQLENADQLCRLVWDMYEAILQGKIAAEEKGVSPCPQTTRTLTAFLSMAAGHGIRYPDERPAQKP